MSREGAESDQVAAADRAPARLKIVGVILAVVGVITLIGATDGTTDMTRFEVTLNIVIACLLIVSGSGLCLSTRWAWPIALMLTATAICLGLYLMVQPGDITAPGASIVAAVVLIIPGALLGAALLTPRSLRWFLRR